MSFAVCGASSSSSDSRRWSDGEAKRQQCQSLAGHFEAFLTRTTGQCVTSGPLGFSDSPLGQTEQIPARVASNEGVTFAVPFQQPSS